MAIVGNFKTIAILTSRVDQINFVMLLVPGPCAG
jgi:hypothetical protein